MNHFLYLVCNGGFLLLPVVLLACRFFRPRWMPWWGLFLLTLVLGWLLINGTSAFYFAHLRELYERYPSHAEVPETLAQRLANDGGKRVMALFFGWVYGLLYLLPFLGLYGVIQGARHLTAMRRTVRPGPFDADQP